MDTYCIQYDSQLATWGSLNLNEMKLHIQFLSCTSRNPRTHQPHVANSYCTGHHGKLFGQNWFGVKTGSWAQGSD